MKELAVIIPVYNEGEIIEKTALEWIFELEQLKIDYDLIFYDGNSKDKTIEILEKIRDKNKNVIIEKWEHIGHGPTLVRAYKETTKNYEWLFQADSDNEISPKEFFKFWRDKKNFDLLIGIRQNRQQELSRKITTTASRILIKCLFGKVPYDTNCPFRLMKSETFRGFFNKLSDDILTPNIFISAFTGKYKLTFKEIPVEYKFRETGCVSINKWSLFKIAVKSFIQISLIWFRSLTKY